MPETEASVNDEDVQPAERIGASFFSRAVFAFFLALLVLSIGATAEAIVTNAGAVYLSTLSVGITFVAAVHYRSIVRIREGGSAQWLAKGTRADVELQIDALRMSDWLVTMPLLVLKFYALLGRDEFGHGYDSFYTAQEQPALIAAVMVALGAAVRLATDDFHKRGIGDAWVVGGVLCYGLALACLALLLIEFSSATHAIEHSAALRSFFWVWLGYPALSLLCIALRWRGGGGGWSTVEGQDRRSELHAEWLVSLVRDIGYGALDAYSKGVFVVFTVAAHFGVPILGWTQMLPIDWK